jgi:hypothetical protein
MTTSLPLIPAFSLWPMLLSGQKRVAMILGPIFGYLIHSVVTLVTLERKRRKNIGKV